MLLSLHHGNWFHYLTHWNDHNVYILFWCLVALTSNLLISSLIHECLFPLACCGDLHLVSLSITIAWWHWHVGSCHGHSNVVAINKTFVIYMILLGLPSSLVNGHVNQYNPICVVIQVDLVTSRKYFILLSQCCQTPLHSA